MQMQGRHNFWNAPATKSKIARSEQLLSNKNARPNIFWNAPAIKTRFQVRAALAAKQQEVGKYTVSKRIHARCALHQQLCHNILLTCARLERWVIQHGSWTAKYPNRICPLLETRGARVLQAHATNVQTDSLLVTACPGATSLVFWWRKDLRYCTYSAWYNIWRMST